MLGEIPTACDPGEPSATPREKIVWRGYKLASGYRRLRRAGVSALLSFRSLHDSAAFDPLESDEHGGVSSTCTMSWTRAICNCSLDLHEHCRALGHVPLIDHDPRGGEKIVFEPSDAIRYREAHSRRADG